VRAQNALIGNQKRTRFPVFPHVIARCNGVNTSVEEHSSLALTQALSVNDIFTIDNKTMWRKAFDKFWGGFEQAVQTCLPDNITDEQDS
jgi:hypothetical protein